MRKPFNTIKKFLLNHLLKTMNLHSGNKIAYMVAKIEKMLNTDYSQT